MMGIKELNKKINIASLAMRESDPLGISHAPVRLRFQAFWSMAKGINKLRVFLKILRTFAKNEISQSTMIDLFCKAW